jgi:hypothetical protein
VSADSSAGSAASSSGSSAPACACSGTASKTPSAEPCSSATGRTTPAFPMSARYEALKSRESMFSVEASPARTSVRLDVVPGFSASAADYGLSSPVSFANYDPATCSWRTSQGSLFGGSETFSETWPMTGTTRSGTASRLRPSVPRIYERASGFWPTPVASESKRTTPYAQGGHSLAFTLGGMPNPRWLEWLMGFPVGWTSVPWATPSSRTSPNSSAAGSSTTNETEGDRDAA